MWEIYSAGDADFLAMILNGVAMLSNAGVFARMMTIGAIIGVLLTVIAAIPSMRLDLHKTLFAWIIIVSFMVPTSDVTVHDIYTGESQVVANVPIGLASVASLMSEIGYELTQSFETAFTVPSVTGTGFLDPVQMVVLMRDPGLGEAIRLSQPAGDNFTDFELSWRNYLRDCYLYAVQRNAASKQQLTTATDLIAAVNVASPVWATTLHLPGDPPEGGVRSCTDAYTALTNNLTSANFTVPWDAHIQQRIGNTTLDPSTALGDSLTSLFGVALDGQQFMYNMFAWELLSKAEMDDALQRSDVGATIMLSQAAEQHNIQNAAEGHMWLRYSRTAATFVEAFTYAVTPFIVFLILAAPSGTTFALSFLKLAAWVQSWYPIMSITNAYTTWIIQVKLEQIVLAGGEPLTIRSMQQWYPQMSDWLGQAGMFMAATPALSMMLIWGGTHAAVAVADRMRMKDTIDEKQVAPDVFKNAPALNVSPSYAADPTRGVMTTNADKVMPKVDTGVSYSAVASSESTNVAGTRRDLSTALEGVIQSDSRAATQSTISNSGSFGKVFEGTQTGKVIRSKLDELGIHSESGSVQSDAYHAAIGIAMSGASDKAKRSAIAQVLSKVKPSAEWSHGEVDTVTDKIMQAGKDLLKTDSETGRQFREAYKQDLHAKTDESGMTADQKSARATARRALNQYEDAQERFQNISKRENQDKLSWSGSAADFGALMKQASDLYSKKTGQMGFAAFMDTRSDPELKSSIAKFDGMLARAGLHDRTHREEAAAYLALQERLQFDPSNQELHEAYYKFAAVFGSHTGVHQNGHVDAERNKPLIYSNPKQEAEQLNNWSNQYLPTQGQMQSSARTAEDKTQNTTERTNLIQKGTASNIDRSRVDSETEQNADEAAKQRATDPDVTQAVADQTQAQASTLGDGMPGAQTMSHLANRTAGVITDAANALFTSATYDQSALNTLDGLYNKAVNDFNFTDSQAKYYALANRYGPAAAREYALNSDDENLVSLAGSSNPVGKLIERALTIDEEQRDGYFSRSPISLNQRNLSPEDRGVSDKQPFSNPNAQNYLYLDDVSEETTRPERHGNEVLLPNSNNLGGYTAGGQDTANAERTGDATAEQPPIGEPHSPVTPGAPNTSESPAPERAAGTDVPPTDGTSTVGQGYALPQTGTVNPGGYSARGQNPTAELRAADAPAEQPATGQPQASPGSAGAPGNPIPDPEQATGAGVSPMEETGAHRQDNEIQPTDTSNLDGYTGEKQKAN